MVAQWRVLDPLVAQDRRTWLRVWERSCEQLPFTHPGFADLFRPEQARLLAALLEDEQGFVFYPFILRDIGHRNLRDITSPYGYAGPVYRGIEQGGAMTRYFWSRFDAWAQSQGVVSEFIRLSLFDDGGCFPGPVRVRHVNYLRELDGDSHTLWAGLKPNVRQNLRRSARYGLTPVIDEDGAMLDSFVQLYSRTMARRQADQWYRFDRSFFERLQQQLPGRLIYVFAMHDGEPVSADLVILGAEAGYYFLGGTDEHAFSFRPNELVKTAAMEWLQERGYGYYVLGGGKTPGDGLERYKRGFAPLGARSFRSGERILDTAAYAELVDLRQREFAAAQIDWDEESEYFPRYRVPLPADLSPGRVRP